ncbi:MAG: agmatinase family protein [Bacteriovoracia bacterium]
MSQNFDPNAAATEDSGIFGLPYTEEEAKVVYVPVPWDATTSYAQGTANGPDAILEASHQLDLFDYEIEKPYAAGLHMLPHHKKIKAWNREAGRMAKQVREKPTTQAGQKQAAALLKKVNALGNQLNDVVFKECDRLMKRGKIVGLVGGDHSTPYGAIQAAAQRHAELGILHFDAHLDLRQAYEGFTWSHASIMNNVLETIPQVKKLVQVGIRDFSEGELQFAESQGNRVEVFFDLAMARHKAAGVPWVTQAKQIIAGLPKEVWVSFDIDGLDPAFCPHTGTPVPGGISFHEANFVLRELVASGRTIVGFDLNEVGGEEWDANVGMRMLYKLTGWCLVSQKLAQLRN